MLLVPPWKHHTKLSLSSFLLCTPNRAKFRPHRLNSSLKDDSPSSSPNQNQLGYDPSEELFGLDVDMPPRDIKSGSSELRSWFGPNGQYIRELPCPSCRGRGYTPCSECGIDRSRQDCSLCSGKGIMTCQRCLGERVIWEESIDEKPWEKARSISPLKVKEDDEVDNMDLKLGVRKRSKRVYRSPTPEVSLKISRSLKSLNAKTGLFSKRMKIIHRDPALHAQRVAAIKKAKGTPAARKQASEAMKAYFSDPEKRQKRSIAMKGVKFFCKNCGGEGHRRHYCPELGGNLDRRFKCGLCKERGHNKRTCQKPKPTSTKQRVLKQYHCRACGKVGHNSRTCTLQIKLQQSEVTVGDYLEDSRRNSRKPYRCGLCGQDGHNSRSCSMKMKEQSQNEVKGTVGCLEDSRRNVKKPYHCSVCGQGGHNSRRCHQGEARAMKGSLDFGRKSRRAYHCRNCGQIGHNLRTCIERTSSMNLADRKSVV